MDEQEMGPSMAELLMRLLEIPAMVQAINKDLNDKQARLAFYQKQEAIGVKVEPKMIHEAMKAINGGKGEKESLQMEYDSIQTVVRVMEGRGATFLPEVNDTYPTSPEKVEVEEAPPEGPGSEPYAGTVPPPDGQEAIPVG